MAGSLPPQLKALGAAALLLTVLIGAELFSLAPPPAAPALQVPLRRPVAPRPPTDASPTLQALTDLLLARPLFSPDRRPPPAAGQSLRGPAPLPRLAGTIVAAGERLAMLVPAGQNRPLIVREGGQAGDLHVLRIADGAVLAESKAGRVTLTLGFSHTATANPAVIPAFRPLSLDPRRRRIGDQDE